MASRYGVTVAQCRAVSGINTDFISDADFLQLIESAEYEADRLMNTRFVPTTKIELLNGDNSERIVVSKNPLLKVRALEIDDTSIDLDDIRWNKDSGVVWLESSADKTYFLNKTGEKFLTKIKYDYGYLDETSTQTTTDADASSGSSVVLSVDSETGFSSGDYVLIQGFDGFEEVAKVTGTDTGELTVDVLVTSHESGSLITKLEIPGILIRLVQLITAMMGVARVVGASYDEITSYSAGEISVTKGEPYTQWRETTTQLQKEYKSILQSFRTRPVVK